MKIIVFSGPSLGEIPNINNDDIIWLPPAGQGDFLSAVHRLKPDVAVIIDTLIWPHTTVWHKEIIWALSKGVRVIGTAAVGALRAAELSFCGMKGWGQVYDQAAAGNLEDDAEVFCIWEKNDSGYKRLTEPLVNIRATLDTSKVKTILTMEERTVFFKTAQQIYYKNRTFNTIKEAMAADGMSVKSAESILSCVQEYYVDVQLNDAIETLKQISDPQFLPKPLSPETMDIPIDDRGSIFRMLYDNDRIVERDGITMRLNEIGNFVTTHHKNIEPLVYNAFNRDLTLILADQVGLCVPDDDIAAYSLKFRRKSGLMDNESFGEWLTANDMNLEDFSRLMEEETLIRQLHTSFLAGQMFQKNTRPLLDLMRLTHEYPPWRDKAFDRETTLEGHTEQLHKDFLSIDFSKLLREKQSKDPLPWNDEVQSAADTLGIGAKELRLEITKDRLRDELLLKKIEDSLS